MQSLLLFLLILSFNNFCFATTSIYIEKNTMRDICENIECLDDALSGFESFYNKRPLKAMAIQVRKDPDKKKLVMEFWSYEYGSPDAQDKRFYTSVDAEKLALEACSKGQKSFTFKFRDVTRRYSRIEIKSWWGRDSIGSEVTKFSKKDEVNNECRILFTNGNIETAFYNQLIAQGCESGYIESSNNPDTCIRLPENSTESDSGWTCNEGFFKAGDTCKQNIIPENASASGSSWECNAGYAKKFSVNENTGLVDSSCRLTLPENASENPYTESGWACNEGFIQDGETCK